MDPRLTPLDIEMDAYLLVRAIEGWLASIDPAYVLVRAELDRLEIDGAELELPSQMPA